MAKKSVAAELCYLRDTDKREVDFLVTVRGKPWFAVEAKLSGAEAAAPLRYFGERLRIPFLYQVTLDGSPDHMDGRVRVVGAEKLLAALA